MASLQYKPHFFQSRQMSKQLNFRGDIRLFFLASCIERGIIARWSPVNIRRIFFNARDHSCYSDLWRCQNLELHEDKHWNNYKEIYLLTADSQTVCLVFFLSFFNPNRLYFPLLQFLQWKMYLNFQKISPFVSCLFQFVLYEVNPDFTCR